MLRRIKRLRAKSETWLLSALTVLKRMCTEAAFLSIYNDITKRSRRMGALYAANVTIGECDLHGDYIEEVKGSRSGHRKFRTTTIIKT